MWVKPKSPEGGHWGWQKDTAHGIRKKMRYREGVTGDQGRQSWGHEGKENNKNTLCSEMLSCY